MSLREKIRAVSILVKTQRFCDSHFYERLQILTLITSLVKSSTRLDKPSTLTDYIIVDLGGHFGCVHFQEEMAKTIGLYRHIWSWRLSGKSWIRHCLHKGSLIVIYRVGVCTSGHPPQAGHIRTSGLFSV